MKQSLVKEGWHSEVPGVVILEVRNGRSFSMVLLAWTIIYRRRINESMISIMTTRVGNSGSTWMRSDCPALFRR